MRRSSQGAVAAALALTLSHPVFAAAKPGSGCGAADAQVSIQACTALIAAGGSSDHSVAVALHARAIARDSVRDFVGAIADLSEALRLKGHHADTYYNRANATRHLAQAERASAGAASEDVDRRFASSIADYDEALRLRPNYADAWNNRGLAYYETGQYARALADFTRAIALNPEMAEAFNNRALAYYKLGQYQRATPDFDHTIRLRKNYGNALIGRELPMAAPLPEGHSN